VRRMPSFDPSLRWPPLTCLIKLRIVSRPSRPMLVVLMGSLLLGWSSTAKLTCAQELSVAGQRIMFLGDSNTHAGGYIVELETQLRLAMAMPPELINLGLPSETCCGLSEPDHPFPRPNVQERAARAFDKVKPDVVVICYGMNDGIYHPFNEERFEAYQAGIRQLIKLAKEHDVATVLMTPPPFDPLPMRKAGKLRSKEAGDFAWFAIYENYDDEVLRRYADWIRSLRDEVEKVIDIYEPIQTFLAEQRKSDADYTMSSDGVHFNMDGHRIICHEILEALAIESTDVEITDQFRNLVKSRQSVWHAAWLSHVGHQRPGMKPGLPMKQAKTVTLPTERKLEQLKSAAAN